MTRIYSLWCGRLFENNWRLVSLVCFYGVLRLGCCRSAFFFGREVCAAFFYHLYCWCVWVLTTTILIINLSQIVNNSVLSFSCSRKQLQSLHLILLSRLSTSPDIELAIDLALSINFIS